MKVLFVYPNNARSAASPQIGISSLSAVLKDAGHSTELFDTSFIPLATAAAAFRRKIEESNPDLLAFSCRSGEWDLVQELLRASAKTGVATIVGGPHATIAPEEVIAHDDVDMLVRGEGEQALLEIVDGLEQGSDISATPNLWTKTNGRVRRNDMRPLLQNLDELPFLDWSLWDTRHFSVSYAAATYRRGTRAVGCCETSRGCPYSCTYCISPTLQQLYSGLGTYHREKSVERIIAELVHLKDNYGIDYFKFTDETFIVGQERIRQFAALYKEKIGLPFAFTTRPETMRPDTLRAVADAGGHCVGFGFESGSDWMRRNVLDRKTSQQQIIDAARATKENGMLLFAFVMMGLPFETREMIEETLRLLNIIKPDLVTVSLFFPFKGTPLYQTCLDHGMIDGDLPSLPNITDASILKNHALSSDRLVRLRELGPAFARQDAKFWPILRLMENHPVPFYVWYRTRDVRRKGKQRIARLLGS